MVTINQGKLYFQHSLRPAMSDAPIQDNTELEKSLKTVAKGAGIVFFGMAIGKAFGTINQVLLARILGPEDYGLFNLGITLITIASAFALFVLRGALPTKIQYALAKRNENKIQSIVLFSLKFSGFLSVLISIILFLQ